MNYILGISAYYHDSAAALIADGKIIGAAQEERFSRKKYDSAFPQKAITFLLKEANISLLNVTRIVFYEKPFLKFERLLETYIAYAPKGFTSFKKAIPAWLKEKLFLKDLLFKELKSIDGNFSDLEKILFSEHHFSHAASAFYPSPFEEAVVLTLDGVGEWATTTVSIGKGSHLEIVKEINFPHSLGLLYSAFTYYTGFRVNSGEYKLMGLAPYGKPRFKGLIFKNLVEVKPDGSFKLNMEYFGYPTSLKMINKKFEKLFGHPTRVPDKDSIENFHMDIAASIQVVTEEIVLLLTENLRKEFLIPNLCLAGGVTLNCVANGKLIMKKDFENIWIQPAAGDSGAALGAALAYWFHELNKERVVDAQSDSMLGGYLGPSFSQEKINEQLLKCGAKFEVLEEDKMLEIVSKKLSQGLAVGWFQGKMEFGPRALGNRSILADPRSEIMQKTLNLKVKYRESFRPFAPSILAENVSSWFEFKGRSPYMSIVAGVKKEKRCSVSKEKQTFLGIEEINVKRSEIPAVTHVDYSARIQTVHNETNRLYYKLIKAFEKITGCPILVNTSFNVRGEPIVCSPTDAFKCFMGTELDMLVCEGALLYKEDQNKDMLIDYKEQFELD